MDLASERASLSGESQVGRVLVFSVDDGLFSLHLDWVEAVYESRAVETHRVRVERGPWRGFLLHRGDPALCVDLREAFDVAGVLGETERSAYVVVQSGGYRLAVGIDQVAGVQDLDLGAQTPAPSSLLRDGGIPVGHVVQKEERMLVVLDPHRLLSGARRTSMEPIWTRAKAYAERQAKMNETWQVVCKEPSAESIKVFARLCGRNGRPRGGAAARTVLKGLDGGLSSDSGSVAERIVSEIVRIAGSSGTGVLDIDSDSGTQLGSVYLSSGRVIDAQHGSEWGRMALRSLLAKSEGRTSFRERDLAQHPVRISESSAATLISSLEAVALEQRKRRAR